MVFLIGKLEKRSQAFSSIFTHPRKNSHQCRLREYLGHGVSVKQGMCIPKGINKSRLRYRRGNSLRFGHTGCWAFGVLQESRYHSLSKPGFHAKEKLSLPPASTCKLNYQVLVCVPVKDSFLWSVQSVEILDEEVLQCSWSAVLSKSSTKWVWSSDVHCDLSDRTLELASDICKI